MRATLPWTCQGWGWRQPKTRSFFAQSLRQPTTSVACHHSVNLVSAIYHPWRLPQATEGRILYVQTQA